MVDWFPVKDMTSKTKGEQKVKQSISVIEKWPLFS